MIENLIGKICIYHLFKQCKLCGKCAAVEEYDICDFEDNDLPNEDIEQMIEEHLLAEEFKADNI